MDGCDEPSDRVQVSYWMNRLQHHPADNPLVVTLNGAGRVEPGSVIADHAVHAPDLHARGGGGAARDPRAADRADGVRRRVPGLGLPRGRLPFAARPQRGTSGSTGDGAGVGRSSGTDARHPPWRAEAGADGCRRGCEPAPAASVVRGEVRHARFHPIKHSFRYRAHQWLVDVDKPDVAPRGLRALASFEPRDHVGGSTRAGTLGENVRAFIAAQGAAWTATGSSCSRTRESRLRLRPAVGLLVLRGGRDARGGPGGGAQHLRRTTRLRARPRRPRVGSRRQGVLRLAVLRSLRRLPAQVRPRRSAPGSDAHAAQATSASDRSGARSGRSSRCGRRGRWCSPARSRGPRAGHDAADPRRGAHPAAHAPAGRCPDPAARSLAVAAPPPRRTPPPPPANRPPGAG